MVGGGVSYQLEPSVNEALSKGPLWAQNADGPGARAEELKAIMDDAHLQLNAAAMEGSLLDFINGKVKSLSSLLLDTAASGYVGLRYGLQVLSGDELLGKTSMFSLLVEIRGGPAKGIRYYYDKLPKTTAKQEGVDGDVDTSIEWSRHVLGYSFDFDPGFLVDRVTIDPKLGMWNFQAELPTEKDEEDRVVATEEFKLGNTVSVALEVGLELLSDWYTLRGWYSIDSGYSLLKTGGTITSNRFGIDTYFTAGPTFSVFGMPLKTALLAFFVHESVTLEAGKTEDPDAGEEAITGVSYDGGYAGGGVAISW
jgi:hypothetical protein